ncbi:hypothetical protein [Lutispora sp.]
MLAAEKYFAGAGTGCACACDGVDMKRAMQVNNLYGSLFIEKF